MSIENIYFSKEAKNICLSCRPSNNHPHKQYIYIQRWQCMLKCQEKVVLCLIDQDGYDCIVYALEAARVWLHRAHDCHCTPSKTKLLRKLQLQTYNKHPWVFIKSETIFTLLYPKGKEKQWRLHSKQKLWKTACEKIYVHVQKEGVKEKYKSNLNFKPCPKGTRIQDETSMCSAKRNTEVRNGNTKTIAATATNRLILRVLNTETCDQWGIITISKPYKTLGRSIKNWRLCSLWHAGRRCFCAPHKTHGRSIKNWSPCSLWHAGRRIFCTSDIESAQTA